MPNKDSMAGPSRSTPRSGLLDLPLDCLTMILESAVEYDENSDTNLGDAVRLFRVCKLFQTEVMRAISTTRLLQRMKNNPEVAIIRQMACLDIFSDRCALHPKGDASSFLARYIMIQPYRHLPWNANLSCLVNSVADKIMIEDGLEPDSKRRFEYVHGLCRQAVHLLDLSAHYQIWHLFKDSFQRLLFPEQPTITENTLDNLLFPAKIYLQKPGLEKEALSVILTKGPKVSSSFGDTGKSNAPGAADIFMGSLLEAAIRAGDQNLAALLINYGVDMSQTKPRVDSNGKRKKRKKYYRQYFFQLALNFGDLETFTSLMESSRRKLDESTLEPLLLTAVCNSRPEELKLILGKIPPPSDSSYNWRHMHDESYRPLKTAALEAILHRHARIFGMLLDMEHLKDKRSKLLSRWESAWGLPWVSDEKGHAFAKPPIEVAAERGDEVAIRALLAKGISPHGERPPPDSKADPYAIEPSIRAGNLDGLMTMVAAARSWHVGAARTLIQGGFACRQVQWLLIIGTVLRSRGRASPGQMGDAERIIDKRDLDFWQGLVDAGDVNLGRVREECLCYSCEQNTLGLLMCHKESVKAARDFVRRQLRVPVDDAVCNSPGRDRANLFVM